MSVLSTSENGTGLSVDQLSTVGRSVSCVILSLSFLVGTPGNLLVIWTILRHIKQRSHTVVLILHLAAADLLVLITLPLWIYSLAHSWVFGEASCKAIVYVINVCMFGSVFLITLMSVERFVAICYPLAMLRWKIKTIMEKCLVAVWPLAFLLGVPTILTQHMDEIDGTEQCHFREYSSVAQEIVFLCLETFGGFVVPFTILSICYCLIAAQLRGMRLNSKKKSIALISSVVIAFAVCWLPYHTINIIDLFCILAGGTDAEDVSCVPESASFISGALVFISSSVNPVLYAFSARKFQGSLRESLLVRLFRELTTQTNTLRGTTESDCEEGNTPQTEKMSDFVQKVKL